MNKKVLLVFLGISLLLTVGCGKKNENNIDSNINEETKQISIIDVNSNSRPYGVVINNYPSAVKVQSGLDKAYMIYEFPIEGGMSRSLAMYKDVEDVKIGTVRSARHDYLDYALENDAIFVHFGWSYTARQQIPQLGIDYIDGNTSDGTAFWRENPEKLATEHTVYTNLSKIIERNKNVKGYRTTTDVKPSLNYVVDEVNLNAYEDAKVANNVEIPYSGAYNVKYTYNSETKRYDRYVNGNAHSDYFTKEQYDCKNIIVILLDWGFVTDHVDAAGSNYLDLNNVGTGKGYYITNGYAREINWSKESRSAQTKYTYTDGTEVDINDGNTWIMFQSVDKQTKID